MSDHFQLVLAIARKWLGLPGDVSFWTFGVVGVVVHGGGRQGFDECGARTRRVEGRLS